MTAGGYSGCHCYQGTGRNQHRRNPKIHVLDRSDLSLILCPLRYIRTVAAAIWRPEARATREKAVVLIVNEADRKMFGLVKRWFVCLSR